MDRLFIVPTKADYLRRAELARQEAGKAQTPDLKDGFIKLAEEWERLASTAENLHLEILDCPGCGARGEAKWKIRPHVRRLSDLVAISSGFTAEETKGGEIMVICVRCDDVVSIKPQ